MLSIEHCEVVEVVKVGDLFASIGFNDDSVADDSGDSFIPNEWSIEVRSLDTFYPVDGFRWTKPEQQVKLTYGKESSLQCSPEHIVLKYSSTETQWTKVSDLSPGDDIVTVNGICMIDSIDNLEELDRLCDLQVSIAHSYYADGVLSHNSHFLTFLGAMALRNNVDVLHYTFELSETQVGIRYDSNLCDIDSNAVIDSKDRILTKYAEQKLGRLIIKYFPTNTASIYTLRSHIERLGTKGFRPGLIIIDYADIMRSTRQFDSLRHELKLVYEELRGMAGELGIPVWTASQSNKEGATSEIIDMGNMSEAYGKAMIADVIVSISRRAHEKSTGQGRLYVAKNRAGRDGLVYPLHIDTSKSNFEILGGPGSLDVAMKENESDIKKVLRSKWNEMRNDPIIGENLKRGSDSSDDTGS